MQVVIKIIGILLILMGIVYVLKPNVMKWLIEFFKQGKRIYFAGLIRFVLAIVFLLAATQCNKPKVIGAFGILFLISGLLVFMIPLQKLKSYIEWWQKQSDMLLRLAALIALALGVLIIYSA